MFKNMRGNWLAAVAVLVLVLPALAAAGPFDNLPYDKLPMDRIPLDKVPFAYSDYTELYVLGNSLSDVGNVFLASEGQVPSFPYYGGRFSNGPNYTDYLAETFGLLNYPSLDGGTNFAWGGATTSGGTAPSGLEQLEQLGEYLTFAGEHLPDEDALFVVFLGGNNLVDIIRSAAEAPDQETMMDIIEDGITQAMIDMTVILGDLIGFGAVNIAVPNLPNMGQVPIITIPYAGALNDLATLVSQSYNGALEQLLQTFDSSANIMRVDVYGLFKDVVAHPGSFGLANATDPCFFEVPNVGWMMCPNPDEYLFWDPIHPTTVGHMFLGDAVFDAVRQDNLPAAAGKLGK